MRELATHEKLIFALDIGTRSIIGVACALGEDTAEVLCVESVEHTERAMVDGQIEDINQTARVTAMVRDRISQRIGRPLTEVHVATAGRVLKTKKSDCQMEFGELPITKKQILTLESKAVQKAFEELMIEAGDEITFCCAGYSVTGYTLDGYSFSTLEGHRGKNAAVEIIATFLPNEVIESLYMTMAKSGLEVLSMTLEPIAAMNAVVPKELRLLNIALVDVGAGTSDVAISNNGSVVAYTMATIAGDEVTERAMREFLVDFSTAERLKMQAGEPDRELLEYQDILGIGYSVSREEFLERIAPAVELLAETIAQKIMEANGAAPMATFLVGGGSRTPGLKPLISQKLGLDEKKVAIGGINFMKRLVTAEPQYLSAEYATPIGIAITAIDGGEREGTTVTVNDKRVRMLGGSSSLVIDALLRGGHEYQKIMGRSGKSLVYELDGQRQTCRGALPRLAHIEVNGALAGITTPVQAGDSIRFDPAQNGADAALTVGEAVKACHAFEVELFGTKKKAGTLVLVNAKPAEADQLVCPMDRLKIERVETVGALLEREQVELTQPLYQNNRPCTLQDVLCPGDCISLTQQAAVPKEDAVEPKGRAGGPIEILLNAEVVSLPGKEDGQPYQFFDLLNYVTDLDLTRPEGPAVLRRNRQEASYLDVIENHDQIEISWSTSASPLL